MELALATIAVMLTIVICALCIIANMKAAYKDLQTKLNARFDALEAEIKELPIDASLDCVTFARSLLESSDALTTARHSTTNPDDQVMYLAATRVVRIISLALIAALGKRR